MRTNFETPDDILFLQKVLFLASMHTERIFEPVYNTVELLDYRDALIDLRAKIYDYLEESDPNAYFIEQLKKKESAQCIKKME
jgi:hypothetical protein